MTADYFAWRRIIQPIKLKSTHMNFILLWSLNAIKALFESINDINFIHKRIQWGFIQTLRCQIKFDWHIIYLVVVGVHSFPPCMSPIPTLPNNNDVKMLCFSSSKWPTDFHP